MLVHRNITIFGKVQGVGFRWATLRKARSLQVTGFVRNEPDSSLYIEAEGESEQMDKFIAWTRKGPLCASVEKADVQEAELKNFPEFTIE